MNKKESLAFLQETRKRIESMPQVEFEERFRELCISVANDMLSLSPEEFSVMLDAHKGGALAESLRELGYANSPDRFSSPS